MKEKLMILLFTFSLICLTAVDVSIYEIQYTTDPSGDSPYANQEITTTGIVTAVGFGGFDDNFFISMPEGGEWNGVYIYMTEATVQLGDEVEVTGTVEEYYGFTEISGYTYDITVNVLSSGNSIPSAAVITTAEAASQEKYEGVLVQIEDVTVTTAPDNFGQWYVTDGSGDCQIDDGIFTYSDVQVGNSFTSITGVVDDSFEEYGINPRDINDFSTGADTTPPEINSALATSSTSVRVTFSEAISEGTAENISNYYIDGLNITAVALQAAGNVVELATSEQTEAAAYTIIINALEDLSGNQIEDDSEVNFTGYQEGGDTDLFFSEYVEGSSNNKALEIYNGTGNAVDMSQYAVWRISNGGDWAEGEGNAVELSGTLENGDVFVICNSAASAEIQAVSDLIGTEATYYNGNDAVGLAHNGVLIDAIGEEGADIGTAWDVAGVSEATLNHTLIRKSSVTNGNIDWSASAGTSEANSEWIVHNLDYIADLGTHQGSGDDLTPPVINSATALSETSVEITFNESLDDATAEDIANYQIYPALTITDAVLNGYRVTLTTSQQTEFENYTITVNNVEDLAGNIIAADSDVNFSGFGGIQYDLIADIQNNTSAYEGQTVNIRGIVTIGVNAIQADRTNAYIQDNSNRGINIYDPVPILTLARGSEVEITGTVTQYNDLTEITNPQVTVISVNNDEPAPYVLDLADINYIDLEGTLVVVQGEIIELYSTGNNDYNIEIRDANNNEMTVRVWSTTGIDLSEYDIGYNLRAVGVAGVYNSLLQIVPGYQDHLSEAQDVEEGVVIDPTDPTSNDAVSILYTNTTNFDSVSLYWKKTKDEDYNIIEMESLDSVEDTWGAMIPAQNEGSTVIFYLMAYMGEDITYVPEGAPEEIMSYSIDITSLKAILNVPPTPFNPYAGETISIEIGSRENVKLILRIYDSEGKLVFTPKNFITGSSSIETFEWDGRDKNNKLLPLGLYILHLEAIAANTGNKRTDTAPIVIGAPLD